MKLRIVHLLSEPESERERRSLSEVARVALASPDWRYVTMTHEPYTAAIPPAREATDRGFDLKPAHYGCFLAHKRAIAELVDSDDALLICECDCVFTVDTEEMARRINRAYEACIEHDINIFQFGYIHDSKILDRHDDIMFISQFIETHCYLIPRVFKHVIEELFSLPWDAADYIYTVYGFDQRGLRIGTFSDRPVAVQGEGQSLIDNRNKTSEHTYRETRYT